jgi:uncharacterized membrane protein
MEHEERRNIMDIGPLEYVVIGLQDNQFTSEILPELHAIQAKGAIRVVDLLFVKKDGDGTVTLREVSELGDEELQPYGGLVEELMGLFTAQDIEKLAEAIPPGTSAVIVLLEHTWVLGLTEAVRRAGGVLFTGGLVTPDALAQVSAELAAKEDNYA